MRNNPLHLFEGSVAAEETVWDLFHENSKTSRFGSMPPNEAVIAHMGRLWEALPYDRYPRIALPQPAADLNAPLRQLILRRETARTLAPCRVALAQVTAMLHAGYGVTRDLREHGFPRAFRTVPSGGALYPLELYFHSARVEELQAGIYHYNPVLHELRWLERGDLTERIAPALVQPNLASDAALLVFLTAVFERSVFKYGDRGYRFALLEAGHVAQNMNLAATAMGLGCVNIGGFFDRDIDDLLGLDGLAHSCIYLMAVGGTAPTERAEHDAFGA